MWEKEVFLSSRMRTASSNRSLITCKSGSAGSGSVKALETMQQTELVDLAIDCGLTGEGFPMARVQNVFERADQVDDTFVQSKADKRVLKGETARAVTTASSITSFSSASSLWPSSAPTRSLALWATIRRRPSPTRSPAA